MADDSIVVKVFDRTLLQLSFFTERLGNPIIDTVYIGGGTPSSVNRNLLESFLGSIRRNLSGAVSEWTIEANPSSIDHDFLDICKANGINRLSLGVQSLDPYALKAIGRNATVEENIDAMELLGKHWDSDINVDLLSGLPGQDRKAMISGIEECMRIIDPSHVSFYSLTLEEGTRLTRRVTDGECILPEGSKQDELWLEGRAFLVDTGYENYEISNFAKPGKYSLHNLKYWRMEPYLGIGPSAVSTLAVEGGRVARLENPKSIDGFLDHPEWNIASEYISLQDFMFENFMMGFRLEEGIERKRFEDRFGCAPEDVLGDLLMRWRAKKYVREQADFLALSDDARLILNTLLVELSAHFDVLKSNRFFKS
jgi:oxygen-independent coproporphyrinogen-3 oxidase